MTIGVALIACVILLIENMYYKNKSPPSSGKVSPISVKVSKQFKAIKKYTSTAAPLLKNIF